MRRKEATLGVASLRLRRAKPEHRFGVHLREKNRSLKNWIKAALLGNSRKQGLSLGSVFTEQVNLTPQSDGAATFPVVVTLDAVRGRYCRGVLQPRGSTVDGESGNRIHSR